MSQKHRGQGRVKRQGVSRRGAAGAAVAKAVLETLEDRRLMSTVSLTGGVLSVQADGDEPLKVWVNYHKPSDTIQVYANGQAKKSYRPSAVSSLRIVGGEGEDSIFIEKEVTAPTDVRTGGGDDKITTGGGNDRVDAGAGHDTVRTGDGDDTVIGGAGDDKVQAGRGDDRLDGGDGDDMLEGTAGEDTLTGGDGDDVVIGGPDPDSLEGGAGEDRLVGSAGDDTVRGGTDDDRLEGGFGSDVVDPGTGDDRVVGGRNDEVIEDGSDSDADAGGGGDDGDGGNSDDGGGGTDVGGTPPAEEPPQDTGGDPDAETPDDSDPTPPPADDGNVGGGTDTGHTDNGTDENGNPLAPQPVIEFIGAVGGMAGHTVHVNGLATRLETRDPIGTRYEWDFGDNGSRYNKLTGWTAAHTYDRPGTYTIALTVTDGKGRRTKVTQTVTIAPDTRRAVYVDVNGSDANSGNSPQAAVRSLKRAADLAGDDTKILLRNGQTFDVAEPVAFRYRNLTVGTYGEGAKARLRKVDTPSRATTMIQISPGAENVTIQGIEFDSKWGLTGSYGTGKVPARALTVYGTNVTVRDSTFRNVNDAVNAMGKPRGLLVQDNLMTDELRAYGVWGEGTDHVYLGNTMRDSRMEHLIRTSESGVTRLLIAHNDLRRRSPRGGSVELRKANWFYVANNKVDGGTFRAGLQEDAAFNPNWAKETTYNGVMEGNHIKGVFVNIRPGVQHLAFRNNVVERDGGEAAILIQASAPGYDQVRKTDDVRVEGNTVVNNGASGKFLQLNGHATNLVVKNNLFVAPNLIATGGGGSAALYVADPQGGADGLASFKEISDNVWPSVTLNSRQGGLNYVWSSWGASKGFQTPAAWEAYQKVRGDVYRDVEIRASYQATVGNVTAGSQLRVAA